MQIDIIIQNATLFEQISNGTKSLSTCIFCSKVKMNAFERKMFHKFSPQER